MPEDEKLSLWCRFLDWLNPWRVAARKWDAAAKEWDKAADAWEKAARSWDAVLKEQRDAQR